MQLNQMLATARTLMAENKGLLAMDESTPDLHRRFKALGIPPSEENRRAYREMIVTTPHLEDSLSGVILMEETVGQATADGIDFMDILRKKGIIPGIKVGEGTMNIAGLAGEKVTVGFDYVRAKLQS